MESRVSLSIIIPVYNAAPYLKECLDSIQDQTFKDWECLLVDDGSIDESLSICHAYEARDSRFRVWHKENGGQSSARNLAVANARGEFITFLDSDDFYASTSLLEQIVAEMEADDSLEIIQFQLKAFDEDTKQLRFQRGFPPHRSLNSTQEVLEAFAARKITTYVCDKIFRREIIPESLKFPEGVYFEDERYLIDLLQNVSRMKFSEYGYYYYRLRGGSTTHSEFGLRHTSDLFKKDFHGVVVFSQYPYLYHRWLGYWRSTIREYKNAQLLSDNFELQDYNDELRRLIPSFHTIIISDGVFTPADKFSLIIAKIFGFRLLVRLVKTRKK